MPPGLAILALTFAREASNVRQEKAQDWFCHEARRTQSLPFPYGYYEEGRDCACTSHRLRAVAGSIAKRKEMTPGGAKARRGFLLLNPAAKDIALRGSP